jgi:hypothetical protein
VAGGAATTTVGTTTALEGPLPDDDVVVDVEVDEPDAPPVPVEPAVVPSGLSNGDAAGDRSAAGDNRAAADTTAGSPVSPELTLEVCEDVPDAAEPPPSPLVVVLAEAGLDDDPPLTPPVAEALAATAPVDPVVASPVALPNEAPVDPPLLVAVATPLSPVPTTLETAPVPP